MHHQQAQSPVLFLCWAGPSNWEGNSRSTSKATPFWRFVPVTLCCGAANFFARLSHRYAEARDSKHRDVSGRIINDRD